MKQRLIAVAGSDMQKEFEKEQGLADKYLAEADVKNLHVLYERRCEQLEQMAGTLFTIAEMYAGKGERAFHRSTPDAINAMENVAIAAIELAKSIAGKTASK